MSIWYFTPNYTFAFAFATLKVINSDIILFRFALIYTEPMDRVTGFEPQTAADPP